MGNTTLDLLIKARADFGSAKSQIDGLHQFLQGLEQKSKGIGGLIGLQPDTVKNIEALNKALAKTGQASKALGAIQFPEAKFRSAATQVEAMRRNFEQLQKTDLGKLARDLAKAHGQDVSNPLGWQWNKMTRGMQLQDAMVLRNAYRNALYQPGSGPHGGAPGGHGAGGGRDWGAYGTRAGSWLGSSIGGGMLRTGGAIGSLALGGGIMGAMFTGYRENQQMLEGVDSIFKSIGGNTGGFQALKEHITALGGALQITGAEASKLAETFVRTSGAADSNVLFRAESAGQFGRGLGMDPGASTQLFGRAGLIGHGNSRQSQRDFASLMGKTIADSGMFARSEQVMEGMVGQLERIATTQGRTSSTMEMQSFGTILSELLKNPALRGGGADSIMGMAQRLGNGGDLSMAMMAYGKLAGGNLGKVIEIANSDAMTPIGQLKGFEGSGITDTRADYMVRLIRDMSRGTGMDEGQFAAQHFGVNPELYRQYAGVFDGKNRFRGDGGFRDWLSGMQLQPDQVPMSGMGMLNDIFVNKGAKAGSAHINRLVGQANEYRTNGQLKDRQDLSAELKAAMDDTSGSPEKLQTVMAKIAGTVGAPLTEADKTRQAQADLINALGKLGGYVNELVIEIKGGLTPAIKALADFIDMVTPDTDEQKQAKMRAAQLKSLDDTRIAGWTESGWLDASGNMTDKFSPEPTARAEYERIALERRLGRYASPTGNQPGTTTGGSGNPRWNVSAPNSGVTGGAAASAASLDSATSGHVQARAIYDYLVNEKGVPPSKAVAVVTNIEAESGFKVDTVHDGGTGYGLFGHRDPNGKSGRRAKLFEHAGTQTPSAKQQLDYMLTEPEWKQFEAVDNGGDHRADTASFTKIVESPKNEELRAQERAAKSDNYASYMDSVPASGPATAPAAPVVAPPATAPAAPVAAEPSGAPAHAVDLVGLAPAQGLTGPREQNVGVSVVGDRPISDEERAAVQRSVREQEAKDAAAKAQTAPPTPDPVIGMSTPKSADARVDGQVAININVAKDGKPVSESFRALSFGEPRVPGSGGTAPARNRVEWSNTV